MRGALKTGLTTALARAAALAGWLATPQPAAACGGLFCNSVQSQVVNQAAERIIFSENGDGTVTAVIEVMYEGQADEFAWLLPIPGVPDIEVSSGQIFNELQSLTDPTYSIQTQVEGTCGSQFRNGTNLAAPGSAPPDAADSGMAGSGAEAPPPVTVEASGVVGPYDFTVLSQMEGLDDPADIAIDWRTEHGYDVGELGPDVLRPYLEDGLNLVAFKLTKGNVTGAIRPVRITYEADLPVIPIRPTAVAANENMGVMVFMLSNGRAIPKNYKGLELNEAAIDWFNPAQTYNDVINRAADESGGQGFVTEFSGSTDFLEDAIFANWQREQWNEFQAGNFGTGLEMLRQAFNMYGAWDGFDLAIAAGVTPNDPDLIETALNCFNCPMTAELTVDPAALVEGLFINVIQPVLQTHELLTSRTNITRLYTTMSADEMTLDPIFDVNNDLADVSNLHNATQFIECSADVEQQDAPWRIELPQGDVVRGAGQARIWPIDIQEQPANLRIMQLATSGEGEVVEDNRARITEMLIAQGGDFRVDNIDPSDPSSSNNPRRATDPSDPSSGGSDGVMNSDAGLCSAAPGHAGGGALPYFGLAMLLIGARRRLS